ncbi:MAG: hypothetical protein O7H41_00985 [Planctomycetota bacterium]|nr:hypothetical protein [Planctomycetota bacterium]
MAYFHLLRLLLLPEESVAQRLGKILSPHENPLSMTGEYGPSKAALWEIPFPAAAFVKDGAFHIRHPVLLMGQQVVTRPDDPEDPKVWRVILVEERIERDGVYSFAVLRVLDSDGSRYRMDRL